MEEGMKKLKVIGTCQVLFALMGMVRGALG